MEKAKLVLSSGEEFGGLLVGKSLVSSGELVFTTSLVGYCESLTDPSYFGQILVFSYPLIGNYGVPEPSVSSLLELTSKKSFESEKIQVAGVIISTPNDSTSHWNAGQSLDRWLKAQSIPGIYGLDTRELVSKLRTQGSLFARILPEAASGSKTIANFQEHEQSFFDPNSHTVTNEVSVKKRTLLGKGKIRIAAYDFGIKWSILRALLDLGCEVELLPWQTNPAEVDCQGWLLSNGPGNPTLLSTPIQNIRKVLEGGRPVLGICLGHQLMALAAGAKIQRMKYGNRSHNQPVHEVGTERGFMTSQNHSYAVEESSLPEHWSVWFKNANDHSVEGIKHSEKPFWGVQFHPESEAGPRDTSWVIENFVRKLESGR